MRTPSAVRLFAMPLVMALIAPAVSAQVSSGAAQPPAAKKVPHQTPIHGRTLKDDYFWLREKSNPEVIKHLEAENAYTDEVMAPTKGLQETLYKEMLGRIKQTDLSVPSRIGEYYYYSRTEEGKQYPYRCRRKGSMSGAEEILLDLNALAEGHSYLGLGAFVVSDDANLLAYSTDTTGYRQYTLRIKNLRTGETLADAIERTGSVVWATDNKTLFYTTEDAVSKRSDKFFRHAAGTDGSELLYEEKDELFDLGAGRSLDKKMIIVTSYAKTSREARYLPADTPMARLEGRPSAAGRPRVRRRSLPGALLHHHQQAGEELPRRDGARRQSGGSELEALHRLQPRGEDRRRLVLRRSCRRLRTGRGARLPARDRHADAGVAPHRDERTGLHADARRQSGVRHHDRPFRLPVDGDALVHLRIRPELEAADAAQAAGSARRLRPGAVRGAANLGRGPRRHQGADVDRVEEGRQARWQGAAAALCLRVVRRVDGADVLVQPV